MSNLPGQFAQSISVDFSKAFRRELQQTMRKPIPVKIEHFNEKTTVVYWDDETTTQSRTMKGDKFDPHVGFMACLAKKVYGGHNQYKKFLR